MQTDKIIHSRWFPAAIFLIGVAFFSLNLGARDFWQPDEPDFAQITSEMQTRGDYLLPYLNGEPYSEKPPLLYWSMMTSHWLFGNPKEFSYRLPSVLAGAGCLLLTFLWGKKLFSAQAGLGAVLILASSFQFLWRSSYLQTDMLFAFFCFMTLFFLWNCFEVEKPSWKRLSFFYLALILALLSKGPFAGVIVFLPLFVFLIWEKNLKRLWSLKLVPGLVAVAVCVGWWYVVVGSQAGEGFLRGAFIREHINRFFDTDSHKQPIHYYFTTIWGDLFPWFLFIPIGLYWAWKNRNERAVRFLFVCFAVTFLFLTVCDSKQGKYLLPVFPVLALCMSQAILSNEKFVRLALNLLSALFFVLGITGIVISLTHALPESILNKLSEEEISPEKALRFLAILHPLAAAGLFSFLARSRSNLFRLGTLAGGVFISFLVITHFYPQLNDLKSARPLMERTAVRLVPSAELGCFPSFRGAFAYYSGHLVTVLKEEKDVRDFFASPDPRYCLMRADEWERDLKTPYQEFAWEVDRSRIGGKFMVVIGNRRP